jgi:3-(3-hydroxy-phenyl)propionate hydroxylase
MNSVPLTIERIGPFVYERFAPTFPPVDATSVEEVAHKVAIVGGGPVGLTMALGLARHGVASVVIEADQTVCEGSRAACISRRSLQIVERLGALPAFMEKGLPWNSGRSFYRNDEVFHFVMPHDEKQKLPPMINLQQYYIERYLLDAVERVNDKHPGRIEVRWVSQVKAMDLQADRTRLEILNPLGSYWLNADWVVACDGGQSFVRHALGLELKGTGYDGRYVIIDIELPSQSPTERRAWFDPDWHRGGTVLMHRQPDNLWRIDYQLLRGQSPEQALTPEGVKDFVQRHLDAIGEGHLPWKTVWTSVYRAGAMTLDNYRHGRVLFAGNAAHAMPIFGVRGLNSGFDDADNLAWKLAMVVRKCAPDKLLDSYSNERIEAFHSNAENAMRSTEFMSPPSRGFDLMREAALSLALRHPGIAQLVNPRQTRAISYTRSPLSSADCDAFASGPMPGEVFAEYLAGGHQKYLSDALAIGFTLLHFGGAVPPQISAWALDAQVKLVPVATTTTTNSEVLHDSDGKLAAHYGAQNGAAYLVRPDGHIAARWQQPNLDVLNRAFKLALGNN